ncbi:MAPEG family protein [Lentilitoribacter sp. Alg239-R112]|jgi:hypothetical protein|uniref:MAPEG family protein n=1 Tax=Lentilitoribacter sp. Alg239-R112 TaxID=2305987 RepID=UPI0013A68D36|nr:MAPEG family protein [Lentilitoribacter sp. Alg239-R112]
MVEITPLYGALTAILMAILSTRAGLMRGKYKIALGDGGNKELALNIRRFGNLSEYAAMVIVLMLLMELNGASAKMLHTYGSIFIALRLIHPIVLFSDMPPPKWKMLGRFISAGGTAILMVFGAFILLSA